MPREELTFKDYYEVLHLHPEADAAMVDQAYWHLARLYNAAVPTSSDARSMLEELNEAYGVLRTPELRAEYDGLRDAVMGVGALPETRQTAAEPPPLSVMQKQKTKPKDTDPPDHDEPDPKPMEVQARKEPAAPRFRLAFDVHQIVVPDWQAVVVLASLLIPGGAAIAAGVEPALVLFALIVGVGFTVIPILARGPRFPRLPRPQVALPAIGPPKLADRIPRATIDPDSLRVSTEAMLARWRDSAATPSQSVAAAQDPAPGPSDSVSGERHEPSSPDTTDTDRLRETLRQSTEAIRTRMRKDGS